MKKNIIKLCTLCMMLAMFIGTTAFAALPNMYGKNYSYKNQGSICTMKASGSSSSATTVVSNDRAVGKYISAGVTKRYADSNATIDTDNQSKVLGSGKNISVVVSRSWKTENREFRHTASSWDCSYQPSGDGWNYYQKDVMSYTIKQAK